MPFHTYVGRLEGASRLRKEVMNPDETARKQQRYVSRP